MRMLSIEQKQLLFENPADEFTFEIHYCKSLHFCGIADLFGLRPGLVGDAGLTPCIPTVLTLRYSGRQSPIFYYSETGRTDCPANRGVLQVA